MHHNFYDYEHFRGSIPGRTSGSLIASETGTATTYALDNLADRGTMFVKPGEPIYEGQVVGEHCRDKDIEVNVSRAKRMTNIRAAAADKTVVLKPPREMTLEAALDLPFLNPYER